MSQYIMLSLMVSLSYMVTIDKEFDNTLEKAIAWLKPQVGKLVILCFVFASQVELLH